MKQIGIVTIIDYSNYGNRLQNYATQKIFTDMNFHVITIKNKRDTNTKARIHRILNRSLSDNLSGISYLLNSKLNKPVKKELVDKRLKNFLDFTRKYICETDQIFTCSSMTEDFHYEFEYFVVGSDQVWNPSFRVGSYIDFLEFAPPEKRIALSASFGVDIIPLKEQKEYRLGISNIPYLSVREKAGVNIVKQLTGRDAELLVDPTLLLDRNDWQKISIPDPRKTENKYLLTYFLSDASSEVEYEINNLSKKRSLDIVRLNDTRQPEIYSVNPSMFLDYINGAELVITDSFHGVVFSILFEKPFVICKRDGNSMYSRIETILKIFNLKDREWNSILKTNNWFEIEFCNTQEKLKKERNKAKKFLNSVLFTTEKEHDL